MPPLLSSCLLLQSFSFISNSTNTTTTAATASICAILVNSRAQFNSESVPRIVSTETLWNALTNYDTKFVYQSITHNEEKLFRVFVHSHTLQFTNTLRIRQGRMDTEFLSQQLLKHLVENNRYFSRSLKHLYILGEYINITTTGINVEGGGKEGGRGENHQTGEEFWKIVGPSLETLEIIGGLSEVGDSFCTMVAPNVPNLVSLRFSHFAGFVTEHVIDSCVSNMKKLEIVALGLLDEVTEEMSDKLSSLPRLKEVSVDWKREIHADCAIRLLAKFPPLDGEIDLSGAHGLGDDQIKLLTACKAPSLLPATFLSFRQCTLLSDQGLVPVIQHFSSTLQQLDLSYCFDAHHPAYRGHAPLRHNRQITDETLAAVAECRNLRSLNIAGLKKITDTGMQYLSDSFSSASSSSSSSSSLETLILAGCDIENDGLKHISKIKTLTELDISYCLSVNFRGVTAIFNELTQLRKLSLKYLMCINENEIRLISNDLLLLEELDLSECTGVTENCLENLSKLPNLKKLCTKKCVRLTKEAVERILPQFPCMRDFTPPV